MVRDQKNNRNQTDGKLETGRQKERNGQRMREAEKERKKETEKDRKRGRETVR